VAPPKRSTKRRLLGIDRSGPLPQQTRRGAPLHPWTLPNLVGYVRLAAIPVFLVLAFDSGDGRDLAPALIFLGISLGDYVDGFLARATGQYSRMGALLDPVVDRLTVLSGAVICWHFELQPRWALAVLAVREVATLVLAEVSLRRGVDLEVNWIGRIAVFLVFGSMFWSMVLDWWIWRAGFVVGVAIAVMATLVYVRAARARAPNRRNLRAT
jgi:cardiolipin synthase